MLVFLTLGLVLEFLHGFKVSLYLDPDKELRRELWTLAHAHGTLLSLVQLLFSAAITSGHFRSPRRAKLCSVLLLGATLLLPGGFFLGGVAPTEWDPWIGIIWVPLGGLFLLGGVLVAAIEVGSNKEESRDLQGKARRNVAK